MSDFIHTYTMKQVNLPLLCEEIRNALGDVAEGVAQLGNQITVTLRSSVELDVNELNTVVAAHNPNRLTPEQQTRLQRQERLTQLREENTTLLDLSAYDEEAEPLRQLAQKIAWLEQEILVLRGNTFGLS